MDDTTAVRFREILRKFERELDIQNEKSCCCEITTAQCHAIMELTSVDQVKLAELSSKLSVDKSTASRTIDNLVNKSMVDRRIPPENRRATIISLTERGKNISRKINDSNNSYYSKILHTLPEADLKTFLEVFEQIAIKMKELNEEEGD